jgi:hypothetical protein
LAFLGHRSHAREIVGFARLAIGIMVIGGLGCFQTLFRPATAAMTPHAMVIAGALALLSAFAVAAGVAVYAAAADVDGRAPRVFPRGAPRLR